MHILIAPNSFKHSLDAGMVAEMIRKGLEASKLNFSCECFPIGDGGDGTGALITRKLGGSIEQATVQNAMGEKVTANFGRLESSRTAVIEMAQASGIGHLHSMKLDPLVANSCGTGQLIKQALDRGVDKILMGMGGSATIDGGTGILKALGVRFLDSHGDELPNRVDALTRLNSIDLSGMDKRARECRWTILCDVENKLLGEQGTAQVFGPQKGASPVDVDKLDIALAQLAKVVLKETAIDISRLKYGGAAGGAAASLHAILNAGLVNGIEYFLDLTDFDSSLKRSDLVITGEGSIDLQTLHGKGPYGVARRAKKRGVQVIGLAGNVPLKQEGRFHQYFDVLMAIGNKPSDLAAALSNTPANISRTSREIGNLLAMRP